MIRYPLAYNPILEYYQKIENGDIKACKKIKILYKKLSKDIIEGEEDYKYDIKKANHAIEFIENFCKHSKGKNAGKPFILELWQKAAIASVFGFVSKIDGTRKYRELVLVIGRKNGKSTLAAAIGLYCFCCDNEPGAEIYTVATKKDQAKIIWKESKSMVLKSRAIQKRVDVRVGELLYPKTDSIYKALSSDSDTLDGLNVHCALLDEVHAWKDKNLYDVVVDGTSSREQPLIVIVTTAGTVREGIYDIKYDECRQIIDGYEGGIYSDDTVLPIIYELDSADEWKLEENWVKANPGIGTIKKADTLRQKVKKALKDKRLVKNLLCKDFNIRDTSIAAWLHFDELNNENTFDIKELKPKYGIGGADLSSTTDLTCATILFEVKDSKEIYVLQMYFLPEDLLETRVEEDRVPYDVWEDADLLRTTPGSKVDYKYVVEWFKEVRDELGVYIFEWGYDSWSADYFVKDMDNEFGQVSNKIIQTKKILSNPMYNLAEDLKNKKINYNNNPLLKWCLSNTSTDSDRHGNIQPAKLRNTRLRIDGMASLLDAYVVYENNLEDYRTYL